MASIDATGTLRVLKGAIRTNLPYDKYTKSNLTQIRSNKIVGKKEKRAQTILVSNIKYFVSFFRSH